jgi:hypothetical protein
MSDYFQPLPVPPRPFPETIELRDYFAAAALQGLLAHNGLLMDVKVTYEYAAAMLAERAK